MSKKKKSLPEVFETAVAGMVLPSESDSPFEVVEWEHAAEASASAASFKRLVGAPAKTKAETLDADKFLLPHGVEQAWHDDEGKEMAKRFRALRELLHAELHDLKVFRIGQIRLSVYIVGRTGSGNVVGLKAHQVET